MTGRGVNDGTVANGSETLFVNVQHSGGDTLDKAVAITHADGSSGTGESTTQSGATGDTTTPEKTGKR